MKGYTLKDQLRVALIYLSILVPYRAIAAELGNKITGKLAQEIVTTLKAAGVSPKIENKKEIYMTEVDCTEHGPGAGVDQKDPEYKRPHEFYCEKPDLKDRSKARRLLKALENADAPVDNAMGGYSGISDITVACTVVPSKTECYI